MNISLTAIILLVTIAFLPPVSDASPTLEGQLLDAPDPSYQKQFLSFCLQNYDAQIDMKRMFTTVVLPSDSHLLSIEEAIHIANNAAKSVPEFNKMFVCSAGLASPQDKTSTLKSVWRIGFTLRYPSRPRPDHYVEVSQEGKAIIYVETE